MNTLKKNLGYILIIIVNIWILSTAINFMTSTNDFGVIVGIMLFIISIFLLVIVSYEYIYYISKTIMKK